MAKSRDAFRTISEVAAWLDTPAHVLRFWESKFTQVKPVKRAGGRRYYRPADMALLGGIKKLLHEDGMTIKGAQKILREQGVKHVSSLCTLRVDEPVADAPYIDVDSEAEAEGTEPLSFAEAIRSRDAAAQESSLAASEPGEDMPGPDEAEPGPVALTADDTGPDAIPTPASPQDRPDGQSDPEPDDTSAAPEPAGGAPTTAVSGTSAKEAAEAPIARDPVAEPSPPEAIPAGSRMPEEAAKPPDPGLREDDTPPDTAAAEHATPASRADASRQTDMADLFDAPGGDAASAADGSAPARTALPEDAAPEAAEDDEPSADTADTTEAGPTEAGPTAAAEPFVTAEADAGSKAPAGPDAQDDDSAADNTPGTGGAPAIPNAAADAADTWGMRPDGNAAVQLDEADDDEVDDAAPTTPGVPETAAGLPGQDADLAKDEAAGPGRGQAAVKAGTDPGAPRDDREPSETVVEDRPAASPELDPIAEPGPGVLAMLAATERLGPAQAEAVAAQMPALARLRDTLERAPCR